MAAPTNVDWLRHTLATPAHRAGKALRNRPARVWALAGALALAPGALFAQSGRALPSAPQAAALPATLPLFPLPDAVLFPNASRPLLIYEPRYRTMVADALKGDGLIGMVTLRPGYEADYDGRPPIHAVGCAGRIAEVEELPDGRYRLVLRGLTRFRVVSEDQSRVYRLGRVEAVPERRPADGATLRADRRRLETILATQGVEVTTSTSNDEAIVDMLAQYVELEPEQRQRLLEMDGAEPRVRALIEWHTARR